MFKQITVDMDKLAEELNNLLDTRFKEGYLVQPQFIPQGDKCTILYLEVENPNRSVMKPNSNLVVPR